MLSAKLKLRFLNGGCDTFIVKKRSMPVRIGEHVQSLTGYIGEKLYVDLVAMSDTVRRNCDVLKRATQVNKNCTSTATRLHPYCMISFTGI